jgi:hypothetical protein
LTREFWVVFEKIVCDRLATEPTVRQPPDLVSSLVQAWLLRFGVLLRELFGELMGIARLLLRPSGLLVRAKVIVLVMRCGGSLVGVGMVCTSSVGRMQELGIGDGE